MARSSFTRQKVQQDQAPSQPCAQAVGGLQERQHQWHNENGQKFEPFHVLTFRTADDGRLAVDIENVIGVMSDEARDRVGEEDDD